MFAKEMNMSGIKMGRVAAEGRMGGACREAGRTNLQVRAYHRQVQGSRPLRLRQRYGARETQLDHAPH